MHQVFLSIGGNIGNKHNNFKKVHILIENELGNIILCSSVYETEPWGFKSNTVFWNQILLVKTTFSPETLLGKITVIEHFFGRKRSKTGYMSRKMDIDILYFDDRTIQTDKIEIPHPRVPDRKFVLLPLTEIAPYFIHPGNGLTSSQMLDKCEDKSAVVKLNSPDLFCHYASF